MNSVQEDYCDKIYLDEKLVGLTFSHRTRNSAFFGNTASYNSILGLS